MNPILKFRPLALAFAGACMFAVTSQAAQDLIPLGASGWKYFIGTAEASAPQDAWRAIGFNDSSWETGSTPIGYTSGTATGYEGSIATFIRASSTAPTWTTVYFRKPFTVSSLNGIGSLLLNVYVDDAAVVYINGVEVGRTNVATGVVNFNSQCLVADEQRLLPLNITDLSPLVVGNNVLAIHGLNGAPTSTDFVLEASLTTVDDIAPIVTFIDPPRGATTTSLPFINVIFSEGVTGVNAADLLINNVPATNVIANNPNDYTFYFTTPPTGAVSVAFAASHGIADTDASPTAFAGDSWSYIYDPNAISAQFVISELMPDNENGIEDEDGDTSDWIEIYNPTGFDASLAGWFLTDVQGSNMWRFPTNINMTLGANQYLLVWASGKNRTNNIARLHTNFELRQNGEYLGLRSPEGEAVSEFNPFYPRVETDESYGRDRVDPNLVGFFDTPTPRAANSTSGANFASEPVFSIDSGIFTNNSIVIGISNPGGVGEIRYTLDGNEPTNNSPLYTGALTIGTNVFVKARVFSSTPGIWPSRVIAKTYFFLDASARDFTSNLPIVVMNTSGRSIVQSVVGGGARTKGSLIVLDTFRGRSALRGKPDYLGMAQFEIFGQTSAGFTKQPMNIELNDAYANDVAHSLLGMPSEADWKMRNPWSDKCLMNDFLAYELFEDMGNYSVRRRMVEVFICAPTLAGGNTTRISYPGSYYGVLCFLEKIERDNNRVDIEELTPAHTAEPEIAGGYMFKRDKASGGDRDFVVSGNTTIGYGNQTLKMHEPKPRDVTTAQVNWLINHLNRMTEAMYAANWLSRTGTNHYSHYIDVDSFVDNHWIVEFPKQIDGYRISNFFSKKRHGKVAMTPIWDWNLSFGNANYLEGGLTNGWYWNQLGENDHIWLRRLLYGAAGIVGAGGAANTPSAVMNSGDPDFIQKVIDRWGTLRTNVFNGDRVIARIDEIANELGEAAARNYAKYNLLTPTVLTWPNPGGPAAGWHVDFVNPTTYNGPGLTIIAEMKKWMRGRYNWVDSQFVKAPILSSSGGAVASGHSLFIGVPSGSAVYYTLDGTDPRLPGGNISPSAQQYSQPISIANNVRAFARARIGTNQYSWSPPAMATLYTSTPGLRITEIMYHPANSPTPSFTDEDFEFIELRNTAGTSLNIGGYQIRGGIDFVFPNITLNAGQRVVVVNNLLAFSALYNTNGMIIAGEFVNPPGEDNNLDNTGESLILEGRLREPILDFRYDDDWHKITDGSGFSLVIADDSLPTSAWNDPVNWRAGGVLNGTPGAGEPAPVNFPQVIISEALTHTDLPTVDTIELQNLSGSLADISNWYLSDDRLDLKKYRIPAGTTIAGGGFITFNENQFNEDGMGFALSSTGDELYLASADGLGNLTGYLHGFNFGPQVNGVTFGRYLTSLGKQHFVSQAASTLNAANAGPLIGNVVVSEIHYHPPDVFANGAFWNNSEDEFVELRNRGGSAASLYDAAKSAPWRLNRAVEFDFAPGTSIPAGGYLLVVNFNPLTEPARAQDFRTRFNVPAGVQLVGPYQGDLSNDDETVALFQPDTPFTNANNVVEVPYVAVEEVEYDDGMPWPLAADGNGFSLHRRVASDYADDPINWESSLPTPGRGYTPGAAPTITSQPGDMSVLESNVVTLSVTAGGPGPYRYQWRKNGENLAGKTNSSLTINPALLSDSGQYQALVLNDASYAATTPATLTVLTRLKIHLAPEPLTVRPPTNVVLSVFASSSTPIRYQWRFNGQDIFGETNALLTINNATNTHDGLYSVECRDGISTEVTTPVRLTVLILPVVLSPNTFDPLRLTAVAGETLNLSAQLHGTMPIFTRWRLSRLSGGAVTLQPDQTNFQSFVTKSFVVAANDSGRVLMSITNLAGGSLATGAVLTNALITVLVDTDGDKIPDVYEDANGMDKNVDDANGDLDLDTSKNRDEYIAGTNPQDPLSYLKVDRIATIGSAVLHFSAVSNRSYTVQYSDSLSPAPSWQRMADFGARLTNWSASALDPTSPPERFYRLVTPAQP